MASLAHKVMACPEPAVWAISAPGDGWDGKAAIAAGRKGMSDKRATGRCKACRMNGDCKIQDEAERLEGNGKEFQGVEIELAVLACTACKDRE